MDDTIDLRKNPLPPEAPYEEPVVSIEEEPPANNAISWLTHLSPPPDQRRVWYAALTLAIGAILVAVFTRDMLFTIILALSAVVLILNMFRPHHPSEVAIHATGISIDDEYHHYADMKSFWVEYQPYVKEVSIEFKKAHLPRIHIPLEDSNPLEIRQAMISYVPEKEHELSLLDHLVRLIGV